MKTLQILLLSLFTITFTFNAAAQTKSETFAVSGECGMCKKKIEGAAKTAGATYAAWDVDSKKLTVKYSESSNAAKIQQSIADAGYDTPAVKASDSAYNSLHECCKYERTAIGESSDAAACCAGADCCDKDAACCKEGSCCTDGKCTHDAAHTTPAKGGKSSCCAKS